MLNVCTFPLFFDSRIGHTNSLTLITLIRLENHITDAIDTQIVDNSQKKTYTVFLNLHFLKHVLLGV